MNPIRRHPCPLEVGDHGTRHGHYGVKPAEQAKLDGLVHGRSPAHPARAMNRRHGGDAHPAGDAGIQQVRPIPMGVDDVRSARVEETTNLTPLLEVSPMRDQDGIYRHAPFLERPNDRMPVRVRLNDRRHAHTRAAAVQPEGQPDDDAFQPPDPERPRSGDMEDVQRGSSPVLGATIWGSGRPRNPWCRSQLALRASPRDTGN